MATASTTKFSVSAQLHSTANKDGKRPLYLRYYSNGNDTRLAWGEKINLSPQEWDIKRQRVRSSHDNAELLNNRISTCLSLAERAATSCSIPTIENVRSKYAELLEERANAVKQAAAAERKAFRAGRLELIMDSFAVTNAEKEIQEAEEQIAKAQETIARLQKKGVISSTRRAEQSAFLKALDKFEEEKLHGTGSINIQQWKSWRKQLEEFCKVSGKPLSFYAFNTSWYNAYADFLFARGCFDNTFGNRVKRLKRVLNWMVEENYPVVLSYKKFKVYEEEKEIVYLKQDELDALWDYRRKNPTWTKYIDFFVFQNLTGLRLSDVKASAWTIDTIDGKPYLTGKCLKNKGDYCVPLLLDSRIEQILDLYNHQMNIVCEQKLNKHLKSIVQALFETRSWSKAPKRCDVTITPTRKGKPCESYKVKKWEVISSHCARRGFCTRHMQEGTFGVPDILLMLGSKSVTELKKYIKMDTENLATKLARRARLARPTAA